MESSQFGGTRSAPLDAIGNCWPPHWHLTEQQNKRTLKQKK